MASTRLRTGLRLPARLYGFVLCAVPRGEHGTFLEIGGYDGVRLSNTLWLEACYHWSGVLVEGSPFNFEALEARSGRNRSAHVHAAASCERSGRVQFVADRDLARSGLSGVPAALDALHAGNQIAVASRIARRGYQTVSVPCRSLESILVEHSARHLHGRERVDFFSLDVEGAEAMVLRTVRSSRFGVVKVETGYGHNGWNYSSKDAEVARLLEAGGLVRVHKLTHGDGRRDHVYAAPDVLERCGARLS